MKTLIEINKAEALDLCKTMVYNILESNGYYGQHFYALRSAIEELNIDSKAPEFATCILHGIQRYSNRNRSKEQLSDYLVHHIAEFFNHPEFDSTKFIKEAKSAKLQYESHI